MSIHPNEQDACLQVKWVPHPSISKFFNGSHSREMVLHLSGTVTVCCNYDRQIHSTIRYCTTLPAELPFGPTGPGDPLLPVYPLSPFCPGYPLAPGWPVAPLRPRSPCSPFAPRAPGYPLSPLGPGEPMMTGHGCGGGARIASLFTTLSLAMMEPLELVSSSLSTCE